ncbi:MAG: hypothetical protein HYY17_10710 [Planctomycetes bacterium]|nr:hypothetical protein [Planctomycetota bacterium]
MISIILMMILLGAVTLIFMRTTDTVTTSEARTTVYTNARYALEVMEADVKGTLSFTSGRQRFILDNGQVGTPGNDPTYNNGANDHVGIAADRMIFRTTTTVADTLQTVEIEYCLIPASKCLTAPGGVLPGTNTAAGDPSKKQTIGLNTGAPRPLYTLVRRVRAENPNTGAFDAGPKDKSQVVVQDMELCNYIISFNVEYFANNGLYSNLQPSPCPLADPLGNGTGANDDKNLTPYRIPMIRITLVIVEDTMERQERAVQKTMWIPMG